MKILAIRIKNLASLEGTSEINFTEEPLKSSGIFAITGATGAGKSTILDALCLALYGKTPRYLQAKEIGIEIHDVKGSTISQGDVRGILRDGTADGFAEVDFVGIDAQCYRATWSVRRARNKAEGNMQADTIMLRNISSNVDIPGRKVETYNEIERLVGLSFEQFTRSVLLAQGDFTAFLKANKDDKSSLLEKLTGTYIYSEISRRVFEKCKLEEQQLRELNLKKEGIGTLTEEELQLLSEEQMTIDAHIEILEKQVKQLNQEITWYEALSKLQASQTTANIALEQVVETKEKSIDREQKLKQVEQVQKTRTWVDALQHANQQQQQKIEALKELEEEIGILQEQKKQVGALLKASDKEVEEKNKANFDALPLLEEAKRLDIILLEKQQQMLKAKDDFESVIEKNRQHQQLLQNKHTEVSTLRIEIATIEKWKTEHIDKRPIAENKDIIISKLQDAQKLLTILQSSSSRLEDVQQKTSQKEQEKIDFESHLHVKQGEYELLSKSYKIKFQELRLIPIETIGLEKNEVDRSLENTIQAHAHWKLLYSSLIDFNSLHQRQEILYAESKAKEEALQNLSRRLLIEMAKKETSAQLLQKARLSAAENVATLRANLVENEACPVCGSEDHPYATHNVQLDQVLAEIADAHQENERLYLSSFREHSSLEQECVSLKRTITQQAQEMNTKETAIKTLQQDWKSFVVAQETVEIPDTEKSSWMAEKLLVLKAKQTKLQTQIQLHAEQKLNLEADKKHIDQLKETIDNIINQLKDNKRELVSLNEQHTSCLQEKEKATASLQEVEQSLNPYFMHPEWMSKWKNTPDSFLEHIHAFSKKWKGNIEKLDDDTQKHSVLSATLNELEAKAKGLLEEVSQKTTILSELETSYQDLEQQRKSIFRGEAVQQVEFRLKQSIDEAKTRLDKYKDKQQQLNIDSTKKATQKEHWLKEVLTLESNVDAASQKIEGWLAAYHQKFGVLLKYEELVTLLAFTSDWMDTERATLKSIDDEVLKARSVLAERTQLLELHKESASFDRTLVEASELHTSAKSDLETKKQFKSEIGFKLEQDRINKNRIGDLLKIIATQATITENWSKLNEIIGSADGKKFRQIAQEYTLDVLVGYANIHLEMLTNRYKIQRIPTSLGLQVVDQDMGDEVRTVYSLSGGESFLVSLALALGLASLSSSRMKVESLFIDEGFGSLDPTTLNIAMDALERLHNQGRKVGVISHVQEMTERIPTQIKVSKMASGKSKIEVIGNY